MGVAVGDCVGEAEGVRVALGAVVAVLVEVGGWVTVALGVTVRVVVGV